MNRIRLIGAAAASCVLAGASFGQQGVFSGFRSDRYVTADVTGVLLSLEAGRLDGDTRMDALLRTSTTLALVHGPSLFESYSVFGAGSTSSAVVQGSAEDYVVAADADGLKIWAWSPSTHSMQATLVAEGWANATSVRALSSEGEVTVYGISSDQKTILRGAWDGASWTDESPIETKEVLRQVAPFDLDGDSQVECAVVSSIGFYVIKADGSVLGDSNAPEVGGGEFLLRVPESNGSDSMLYAIPVGGYTYMSVFSGTGFEPSLGLSDSFVDVQAADWDNDGELDLLWTSATSQNTWILYGRHITQSPVDQRFDLDLSAPTVVIPHSAVGEYLVPTGAALPFQFKAVADFDFDGGADIFAGTNDPTREFKLSFIQGDSHSVEAPTVEACSDESTGERIQCPTEAITDPASGLIVGRAFDWSVFAPRQYSIPGTEPTHLEIVCYLQTGFSPFQSSPSPNFVAAAPVLAPIFKPLSTGDFSQVGFDVLVGQAWTANLVYHFAVSPVRQANGVVTHRGPTRVIVFFDDASLASLAAPTTAAEQIPIGYQWPSTRAVSGGVNERPVIRPTPPTEPPSGGG